MSYFIVTLVVVLAAVLGLLGYYGAFRRVEIGEEEVGPFHLAFKENVGDYRATGTIVPQVQGALAQRGFGATERFAVYFDDPKTTKKEELRSEAGCIVQASDAARVEGLGDEIRYREVPRQQAVVARFPFKGFLSVFMGVFKVDPALKAYRSQHAYRQVPVMVIYGDTELTYIAPIEKA